MATMKDVAREAGVSVGTVSAVLNGYSTIKEINVNKVNNAIKKLNYQPNLIARSLKTGNSKSIGLLIPDINNPFYPEVARGVEDAAQKAGLTVFLCNNDRRVEKEREYVNALLSKNVDGIIMVKPHISRDELLAIKKQCGLVLIDTYDEFENEFDIIKIADELGATKAMDLLFSYGHSRIAYISGTLESNSAIARFNAYKHSLESHGFEFRQEYFKQRHYDWFSGFSATKELLRLIEPPTAIFAANDIIAMGALKACAERGFEVPRDISIVGFDDIDQCAYCIPPLTTVRQPKYEIGVSSIDILMKRAANQRDAQSYIASFNTDVIERETVNYAKDNMINLTTNS